VGIARFVHVRWRCHDGRMREKVLSLSCHAGKSAGLDTRAFGGRGGKVVAILWWIRHPAESFMQ
jgi:hypothetical protein